SFGGVGQRGQPPAPLARAVRCGGHCAGHHGSSGQCGVERLPGQVVADVEPVEPVRGLVRPDRRPKDDDQQQRGGDPSPGRQLGTSTFAPVAATVSYTRMICWATTDQSYRRTACVAALTYWARSASSPRTSINASASASPSSTGTNRPASPSLSTR